MGMLKNILIKLSRNKSNYFFKVFQKIKLITLSSFSSITKVKISYQINKLKSSSFLKNNNVLILLIKIKRGCNKKKARKGKIFGKLINQGIKQHKLDLSFKKRALHKIKGYFKSFDLLNSYWINQNSKYKFFEVVLNKNF